MPKTTGRRKVAGKAGRSRSDAGRKGGRATLRARGAEFFSEIGRKGGKSRSRSVRAGQGDARKAAGRRASPKPARRPRAKTRRRGR